MVGDLLETAQVVGRFLEVRYAIPDASVPQRPDQGQEGGLAGAVVADKQGQRGEARGLPVPEAAKVLQRDGIQRHVRRLDGRSSVVIAPYHSQCKRERPRLHILAILTILAAAVAGRCRTRGCCDTEQQVSQRPSRKNTAVQPPNRTVALAIKRLWDRGCDRAGSASARRPGGRSPHVAANGLPGGRQEAAPEATCPSMDGRSPGQAVGSGATSRRAGRVPRRARLRRRRASTARCRCPSRRRCRRGR